MIHRLIFALPKPGMSEKEFQQYWRERHAPIASKIPHTTRYLIASKIHTDSESDKFPFGAVGETWFKNEQEVLEAVQSKEYIEKARPDEPNWAAFWQILVLDTTDHLLNEGAPLTKNSSLVKLFILLKRKPGMSLADFRSYWLETHSSFVLRLPGVRRYLQCHVQDYFYAIGESSFDGVEQIWFDNVQAVEEAINSPEYKEKVLPDLENFVEPKYIFTMVTDEYWVVGPEN